MFNLLKKIFGPKKTLETEFIEDSPVQENITDDRDLEPRFVLTLTKAESKVTTNEDLKGKNLLNNKTIQEEPKPEHELLIDPRNYEYPDAAKFNVLEQTFRQIAAKAPLERLPLLWSSKTLGDFQELTELKNVVVAGAQSTGKTNFVNQLILSILFSKHPLTVKLIIIDSKGLEFGQYEKLANNFLTGLPGEKELIARNFSSVVATLNSLCIEMDNRYDLMVNAKVKNIEEYNKKFRDGLLNGNGGHQYLPFLVLIIDDFGNYSYQGSAEIFQPYIRILTQGYKAGIYSIITTSQTGSKAMPGNVLSLIGSRVVFRLNRREEYKRFLETSKLEIPQKAGEFLYNENNHIQIGETKYYEQKNIEDVVQAVAKQPVFKYPYQLPDYLNESDLGRKDFDLSDKDPLFDDAARLIVQSQSGSTSLLQRRMKLGYNRAGRLMDQLEAAGIVGPNQGSSVRDVLIKTEKDLQHQLNILGLV